MNKSQPYFVSDLRFRDKYYMVMVAFRLRTGSAVDTNTLNLDPDPRFWPDLDLDPGLKF